MDKKRDRLMEVYMAMRHCIEDIKHNSMSADESLEVKLSELTGKKKSFVKYKSPTGYFNITIDPVKRTASVKGKMGNNYPIKFEGLIENNELHKSGEFPVYHSWWENFHEAFS